MDTASRRHSHVEPESEAISLLGDIHHLHPNLQFCGEPRNALLSVSGDLLDYVLALLRDDPVHAPRVSLHEWSELLHILKSHWVVPLLYGQAAGLPDELRPPKTILDRMRESFQWSRARCFHMETQLREVVAAFNNEGVKVLVLKGPALGRTVYPDPALRPSSDLDLLVKPDEMVRSRAILESLGYHCDVSLFSAEETLRNDEKFVHTGKPQIYRTIELHWHLHNLGGIRQNNRIEDLFERPLQVRSSSFTFHCLDPVDALIHTAINNAFNHDKAMRLTWIYDIKLLASALTVPGDWELLQKRSVAWNACRAVELSIEMARAWLGLRVPQGFADFSTWPQPTDSEAAAWSKVISRHHRLRSMLGLRIPSSLGVLEKARLLARLIFPVREKVCRDFPPPHHLLFPLSYVRRWWHWVGKLSS